VSSRSFRHLLVAPLPAPKLTRLSSFSFPSFFTSSDQQEAFRTRQIDDLSTNSHNGLPFFIALASLHPSSPHSLSFVRPGDARSPRLPPPPSLPFSLSPSTLRCPPLFSLSLLFTILSLSTLSLALHVSPLSSFFLLTDGSFLHPTHPIFYVHSIPLSRSVSSLGSPLLHTRSPPSLTFFV